MGYEVGYGRTGSIIERYKPCAQAVRQQDRVPELPENLYSFCYLGENA
jgi:hypothetical protein